MNYRERFKQIRSILLGLDPGILAWYYRQFYKPAQSTIAGIIDQQSKDKSPFYFIQIGGNDGFVNDPIFKFVKKYPWFGIIVEPQVEVFHQRLKKTYRSEKKVILENLAIANKSGSKKLYKLAISNARWATGLASFNRETLIAQIQKGYVDQQAQKEGISTPENIDDYLCTEEVTCINLADLMAKHRLQKLDLLQIDTEGYDFEIIKTIDFNSFSPQMISFENGHLSPKDFSDCEALLLQNGYTLNHIGRDSIACLTNA